MGRRGGINLFAYAEDTPLKFADPSGLAVIIKSWVGTILGPIDEQSLGANTHHSVGVASGVSRLPLTPQPLEQTTV